MRLPAASRLWPLPALLAWAAAWAMFALLRWAEAPLTVAVLCGCGVSAVLAMQGSTALRRWVLALGFPVSLLVASVNGSMSLGSDMAGVPAWAWLLPLVMLALIYPVSAWRDAPLFPTPSGALDSLGERIPLPAGATVLDAGCGLGHGLAALRRAYPLANLQGVERSAPVAWAARLWCLRSGVGASVRRADMWADSWRGCAMVYLFQRPESMPRAIDKARAELAAGSWLASLEFPALALEPQAVIACPDGRPLWLYRAPFVAARDGSRTRSPVAARNAPSVTQAKGGLATTPLALRRQRR